MNIMATLVQARTKIVQQNRKTHEAKNTYFQDFVKTSEDIVFVAGSA
jgi:hypothetical protein